MREPIACQMVEYIELYNRDIAFVDVLPLRKIKDVRLQDGFTLRVVLPKFLSVPQVNELCRQEAYKSIGWPL